MRRCGERGVTLTEVLVVATVSLVVILAVATTDVARVRIGEDIRRRSGVVQFNHGLAALAAWRVAKGLENADRIVLINPDASGVSATLQARIPPTAGPTPPLDTAGAYVWNEYRLVGNELRAYTNIRGGCPSPEVLASEITQLQFFYRDEQPAPPGGEPFPDGRDNNMVRVRIGWAAAPYSHAFEAQVAIRSAPYSNVNASCPGGGAPCDSGRGLAAPGVDDALPPVC